MMREKKRRHIFYLCGRLGIGDEERRELQLSICGKESMKNMTDTDAAKVIGYLEGKMSVVPGQRKNRLVHGPNVYTLMTPDQRKKIVALSIRIFDNFREDRMDEFSRRRFGKPFRSITSKEAARIIEIQKSMLSRKLERSVHVN